jgi:hypothetical protein
MYLYTSMYMHMCEYMNIFKLSVIFFNSCLRISFRPAHYHFSLYKHMYIYKITYVDIVIICICIRTYVYTLKKWKNHIINQFFKYIINPPVPHEYFCLAIDTSRIDICIHIYIHIHINKCIHIYSYTYIHSIKTLPLPHEYFCLAIDTSRTDHTLFGEIDIQL